MRAAEVIPERGGSPSQSPVPGRLRVEDEAMAYRRARALAGPGPADDGTGAFLGSPSAWRRGRVRSEVVVAPLVSLSAADAAPRCRGLRAAPRGGSVPFTNVRRRPVCVPACSKSLAAGHGRAAGSMTAGGAVVCEVVVLRCWGSHVEEERCQVALAAATGSVLCRIVLRRAEPSSAVVLAETH